MKQNFFRILYLFFVFLLAGCTSADVTTIAPTATLPDPQVFTTLTPGAEPVARAFLEAWMNEAYEEMYDLLATESKVDNSLEQFVGRYENVANEAALAGVDYQVISSEVGSRLSEITYLATLYSSIVGDIQREMTMPLVFEQGVWRVQWSDSLILPELAGGNYLLMDGDIPSRAGIYDRFGNPLAAQADAVAIGIYPDYIDLAEDYADGLVALLATVTGYKSYAIREMIETASFGEYLPLGEVPADSDPRRLEILSSYGAVVTSRYSSRLYYSNGIAPHVIGFVSAIQKEELTEYRRQGYRSDEKVGRKGIELWGEDTLTGVRGGTLLVFNPDGKPIAQLGSVASQPGKAIYTTLDGEFQKEVQKALSYLDGAIVVVEIDTGRVLAMASAPSFDPNAFETANFNWSTLLEEIINDTRLPQFNRASLGQYPLGSVYKIITMAAALESQRFTPDTIYECGYVFDELPGFPRYDWTYEKFQENGTTKPSGTLTLVEGLIRSCDPFFWHIGLDLYNIGFANAISDMSLAFGLGEATGVVGIDEEVGAVPVPQSPVDALNLAIGQGDLQVTPLQVARFIAAVGNGGTLYRPQLIESYRLPNGETETVFSPDVQGLLPISAETLAAIQEGMRGVVASTIPEGTAFRVFNGLKIPVAGKTGTSTTSTGDPHAWFAGYTFAAQEGKPDIAIVVIAENGGEGSEIAAPMFRRVVELYFFGRPLKIYRWEANFDVTRSPTPIITFTPTPRPGVNP